MRSVEPCEKFGKMVQNKKKNKQASEDQRRVVKARFSSVLVFSRDGFRHALVGRAKGVASDDWCKVLGSMAEDEDRVRDAHLVQRKARKYHGGISFLVVASTRHAVLADSTGLCTVRCSLCVLRDTPSSCIKDRCPVKAAAQDWAFCQSQLTGCRQLTLLD